MNQFRASHIRSKHEEPPDWVETAARLGFAAKGVVYAAIGGLATLAAFGSGTSSGGSRAALREIAQQPFGQILLLLTGIGLLGYVTWRGIQSILDPENKGKDASGLAKRVGYAGSAVVNAALAVYAFQIALGSMSSGGSKQEWSARLLAQPYGPWLLGTIGLGIIGAGIFQFYRAKDTRFMRRFDSSLMRREHRTIVKRTGQFGFPARGVAFLLIGGFVIQAAVQTDPQEVKGLGAAFETLSRQPYGPWLMGIVALGFVAYAIYCFMVALYRRF